MGLTSLLPASGNKNNQTFVVEGYTPPKGANMNLATVAQVNGDYFRAMGIPLLRGRYFTDADKPGAQLVLIVNRRLAQHYWPNQDPIGKRFRIGTPEMKTPWLTIVGEVADIKLGSPDEPTKEEYYIPVDQAEETVGRAGFPRRSEWQRRLYRIALVVAAGTDGKCDARHRTIARSLAPADTGADHGAGRVSNRSSPPLQHRPHRKLRICRRIARRAWHLQRHRLLCRVAGAGDGHPHGSRFAARLKS